jgi:hypothetical protein
MTCDQRLLDRTVPARNYTRPANVCLEPVFVITHTYCLVMSYLLPSTSLQSTKKFGQDAKSGKSQRRRYAFCCHRHAYRLAVTSPTGNSSHTAAIDILDNDSLLNIFHGGTNLPMFVKDGETSCLEQHPTWVFASSVPNALPSQICWRTHLPFHLLLTTIMKIPI